jgi:hypothetical protein
LPAITLILVLFWLLVGGTLGPVPAAADEELSIDKMTVFVWPEYDDPRVLVQYEGQFTAREGFPRQVAFRIPGSAAVNSACGVETGGKHTSESWRVKDEGDGYALMTYQLAVPTFHLEFYYNPIQGQTDKTIDYLFKPTYLIKTLEVEVQKPLKATEFKITPPSTNVVSDSDGFNYYHYTYDQVSPDQPIALKIAYSKSDPNPSVSAKPGAPQAAQASPAAAENLPLLIGLAGGGLALGVAGYWFVVNRSRRPTPARARAAPPAHERGRGKAATGGYCANCGQAMHPEDNFCPSCGQKRRHRS